MDICTPHQRNWKGQEDLSLTFYKMRGSYLDIEQSVRITGMFLNLDSPFQIQPCNVHSCLSFDQSSCHRAFPADALNVSNMNLKPSGKQTVMHDNVGKKEANIGISKLIHDSMG